MTLPLDTIITRADGGVLRATFDAPPINLIGSEIVRDLVTLLDNFPGRPESGLSLRQCRPRLLPACRCHQGRGVHSRGGEGRWPR